MPMAFLILYVFIYWSIFYDAVKSAYLKFYSAVHFDKCIYHWTHTPINISDVSNTPESSLH